MDTRHRHGARPGPAAGVEKFRNFRRHGRRDRNFQSRLVESVKM
jgi:hypothetical protein